MTWYKAYITFTYHEYPGTFQRNFKKRFSKIINFFKAQDSTFKQYKDTLYISDNVLGMYWETLSLILRTSTLTFQLFSTNAESLKKFKNITSLQDEIKCGEIYCTISERKKEGEWKTLSKD